MKDKGASANDDFYTSVEEWEAENFPTWVKQRKREELGKNPEALGGATADDVFRSIELGCVDNCVKLGRLS